MTKKNLIMILASLCLVVSLFFTVSGPAAQVSAAVLPFPIFAGEGPFGKISPTGVVLVKPGASKTFTITPFKGAHIADVLVDGVSKKAELVKNKYTFTNVTSPHRILALFASSLVINAGASSGGSISPSGLVKVDVNGTATFELTADEGSYIAGIIVDGVRVPPARTFTFKKVIAAHSIIAIFNQTFPVLATASEGGSISPSPSPSGGVTWIDAGDYQVFTMTPNQGYHLVDVRVDEKWIGALTTFNLTDVKAPHDIMAVFSNQYPLVAKAGAGGTISPAGSMTVTAGTSQTFTITPKTGYYISDVKVDGASVETVTVNGVTSYTLTNISSPHLIVAIFTKGTPPN
jgi:hypothetical protein